MTTKHRSGERFGEIRYRVKVDLVGDWIDGLAPGRRPAECLCERLVAAGEWTTGDPEWVLEGDTIRFGDAKDPRIKQSEGTLEFAIPVRPMNDGQLQMRGWRESAEDAVTEKLAELVAEARQVIKRALKVCKLTGINPGLCGLLPMDRIDEG